MKGGQAMEKK